MRSWFRVSGPLGLFSALAVGCGGSSAFDGNSNATGGTGGTGSSGTLSTLLDRCNALCAKAASQSCGVDSSSCHTACSNGLDEFQHCTGPYDALLDCAEALTSVCPLYDADAANPPCTTELGDYTHCVNVCDADKTDPICK
jgi:hypothetical protein